MRKSKYDEAFPSQPISEKEKQSSEIDKRIELSSEIINLNQQIESIKKLSKDLKVLDTLAINAIDANEKSLKALNAAMKSSDNIVNGICNAITRVHQTTVKVDLTDDSKSYLEAAHHNLIENENMLIKNHEAKVDNSLKTLGNKVENAMNSYRGIFVDKKTFNIYYWLFIVIIEIALCSTILLVYYVIKFGKL